MWDFLNQNASAVFTFLTFVSTLFIPYLLKQSELNLQKRNNDYSNYKEIYVSLAYNIGKFHMIYNEIYNAFTYTETDIKVFNLSKKSDSLDTPKLLAELNKYYFKSYDIYAKSLFIHSKVGKNIEECLGNQYRIIYMLERVNKESLEKYVDTLEKINSTYLSSLKNLKHQILRYL